MTNENLKVGDCPICDDQIVLALSMIDVSQVGAVYRDAAVELIKSQQSRIELLESAIREFNKDQLAQENYAGDDDRYHEKLVNKEYQSILTLRNLMENKP